MAVEEYKFQAVPTYSLADSNSAPRETGFSKPKTTIPFLLLTLHMAIFNPD